MPRRAIVVGCGIGGPVAALALQRAGIQTTVFEAHARGPEAPGQCLNLTANGLDVLHTLGLDAIHSADGVQVPRLVLWNAQGVRLGELPNGLKLRDGTVSIVVQRSALERTLRAEAARAGADLQTGRRVMSFDVDGGAVVAQLADGGEAVADVLIGADGLQSKTRRHLDPHEKDPTYAELLMIAGVSRASGVEPTPGALNLVFGRRALFEYTVRDSGDAYWFAALPREHEPLPAELLGVAGDTWRQALHEVFESDSSALGRLISASGEELGAYPVYELERSGAWHKGPVALLGDAAHSIVPTAWQGAALAMEDAIVLAMCLRDIQEPTIALQRYEELRRPRVARVCAWARGMLPTRGSPLTRWLRGRLVQRTLRPEGREWLYHYHVDWSLPMRAA